MKKTINYPKMTVMGNPNYLPEIDRRTIVNFKLATKRIKNLFIGLRKLSEITDPVV